MSKGVALVTGAAQGIGRAIAIQLAADGFDVAVNDIASKATLLEALSKEIESKGQRSVVTPGDVTLEKEVEAMVAEVASKLGSLDVMVANAGIYRANPLLTTPVDEYDRLMAVNTRGPMLCYKYAAKQMIAQGRGGRIIGATSIAGRKAFPGSVSYVMSKFAVRGLTQAAAIELGEYNITVNAYAPGLTNTPMLDNIDTIKTGQLGIGSGEYIERGVNNLPIKRVGQPQDIANLVSFLASEKASYITGQTYGVDGGMIPS
ncbi:acetoin reductase family protein [Dentipellis sp. KUC8613]|nr:acetoin reductase family protein [Dentipellis sp. KUC8613]